MDNNTNLCDAMLLRKSVRTYLDKPIPEDLLNNLIEKFNDSDKLNNLSQRLIPVDANVVEPAMVGIIGNYGSIKNAPLWIIGISEDGENYQENFGFRMERFILECTNEGLGTCWIGGYFRQSQLEQKIPRNQNERIVCISPLGYAAKRRLAERTLRSIGGLNLRKPLSERVFVEYWGNPATEYLSSQSKLHKIFELARWSPSSSNIQPCHYVIDGKKIIVSVLTSLKQTYPRFIERDTKMNFDYQEVDAGISMAHIFLAARELSMPGQWSLNINKSALRQRYRFPDESKIIGVFDFLNE